MPITTPKLPPKAGYIESTDAEGRPVYRATRQVKKERENQAALKAFAATSAAIPDDYALDMPTLFPTWEDVLTTGKPLTKGAIINDNGQLYRVNQDQTLPQAHQPPHGEGMTAVYVPINKTNAGTKDDPIPAVKGMEYTYGLYYLDPEDRKTYLCKRTGEADGGTVVLQYLPHDLIEQYFEVVA